MALSALDIAEYFLTKVDDETGDSLSNLKLQKLVYYAQGYHLALHGRPLFDERIEAWEHGPVIPALYAIFKQHRAEPIPPPENFDVEKFDPDTVGLLDEVYDVYGQFSAWKLRNMTHEEIPWKRAYGIFPKATIDHESMAGFFRSQLVNG